MHVLYLTDLASYESTLLRFLIFLILTSYGHLQQCLVKLIKNMEIRERFNSKRVPLKPEAVSMLNNEREAADIHVLIDATRLYHRFG